MSAALKSSTRLKNKRRHGDPWISKNRVLNGGTSKSKRNCPIYRNPNFDTDETKLLIQLWGDPKVQRELVTTHKKHVVISQLSAKMEEYGYYRSPEEITTRIKNMKCFYNRLKKEMESSKGMDPSWRHYAEMDAIMTRPIFSVRPNEVPAPSLKYLLEQEQEKRKERKRRAEEDGSTISDSDDDIADILAVPSVNSHNTSEDGSNKETPGCKPLPNNESETEKDGKTLEPMKNVTEQGIKASNTENIQSEQNISDAEITIKMEVESEEFQEFPGNEENDKSRNESVSTAPEETIKTINISEDDDLLVPKLEPIDVDDEYDCKAKQTTSNSITQNFSQLADILKQPAKTQNMSAVVSPSSAVIKFALPSSSMPTPISTTNTSIPTQSKISIVSPTILMPPQMATKPSDLQQRQVRLPGNLHALLATPGSRTTVTNTNGMKFLLVNAADQRGPPITTSNLTTGNNRHNSVTNQSNLTVMQNVSTQIQKKCHQTQQQQQQLQQKQQQQQLQQQQQQQNRQQSSPLRPKEPVKRTDARQEYKEQLKKRDLLGIKTTLLKILKVQEDANEIQSERVAIERDRLQFERSMAEKFLSLFEQNQKTQQQLQQQLQLQHQQQQQVQLSQSQQQPSHIQVQQRPPALSSASQVFTATTNQTTVAPNGQIILPSKLLITTMVPTSVAQAANVANSKVLTTTGFTNLNSTSNNELQLVVPKEEPQN